MINKFYTLTDWDTNYTNSRSKRYDSLGDALAEARRRMDERGLVSPRPVGGIYIMQSIKFVGQRPPQPPLIEVIDIS